MAKDSKLEKEYISKVRNDLTNAYEDLKYLEDNELLEVAPMVPLDEEIDFTRLADFSPLDQANYIDLITKKNQIQEDINFLEQKLSNSRLNYMDRLETQQELTASNIALNNIMEEIKRISEKYDVTRRR